MRSLATATSDRASGLGAASLRGCRQDGSTSIWPGTIVAVSSRFRSRSSQTPWRGSPEYVFSAIDQSVSPALTR